MVWHPCLRTQLKDAVFAGKELFGYNGVLVVMEPPLLGSDGSALQSVW